MFGHPRATNAANSAATTPAAPQVGIAENSETTAAPALGITRAERAVRAAQEVPAIPAAVEMQGRAVPEEQAAHRDLDPAARGDKGAIQAASTPGRIGRNPVAVEGQLNRCNQCNR